MNKNSNILIAGSTGLVGSTVTHKLRSLGYTNLITPSYQEVDLINKNSVQKLFRQNDIDYVFLLAAKVGGIGANSTYPGEFIYINLMIQTNILHAAMQHGVEKLLFPGSSCIYPRQCQQPIKEEYLLSGPLEKTNEPYAIAKIAGLTMCEAYHRQYGCNFISVMPTNLYGPGDSFDLKNGHVLPVMIRKFHEALPDKTVTLWGTGSPRREFLYISDLADACILLMKKYDSPKLINIGSGDDLTIRNLALMIQRVIGHNGPIVWDSSKPDGTPRKLLDVTKIKSLGWEPKVGLAEGIQLSYNWFLEHRRCGAL